MYSMLFAMLKSEFFSLLSSTQSLRLDKGHSMCPHVSVQVSLSFKHLPTHFAFGVGFPIVVLVRNVQLVLPVNLIIIIPAPSVVSGEAVRLLQPMIDEEVSGQWSVGGVAQAALLTLEGRAIGLVLGNVFVESGDVLWGEPTNRTLVNFGDVHLEPLQRLWVWSPGVQTWRSLILLWLPLWAGGL